MTPLWIDTDMGFDDMLAVMMVQQSHRSIDGCSLVFGNTVLGQIRRNAADMAACWGWDFPIHVGASAPLTGPLTTAETILGPSGLPTRGRRLPAVAPLPDRAPALAALTEWIERTVTPVEILALGPLTNIAALADARPDLLAGVACVTWMGGGATSGNHTPVAEFNAFADPEAAAIVCASGVALKMIDLDVCRQVTMAPPDLQALRDPGSDKALLLHDLLGGFIDIGLSKGRPSQPIFDPVAAATIVDAATVTFEPVDITVDVSDTAERGRTVIGPRNKADGSLEIATAPDVDRIRTMAMDALLNAARG